MKFQRLNTREGETTVGIMGKGLNSAMVATREIMVFLRFQQFAKTINHINKYIVIMPGVQMAMWQGKNTAKLS